MKGKQRTVLGLGYKMDATEFLKTALKVEEKPSPFFLATYKNSQLTVYLIQDKYQIY